MTELTDTEAAQIEELVLDYEFSPQTDREHDDFLNRWPNPATRERLHKELLHVDLTTDLERLLENPTLLKRAVQKLTTPSLRIELCRAIYTDLIESWLCPTWELFADLDVDHGRLGLRYTKDFVGLGDNLWGKYRLVERVGQGMFGVVFRGVSAEGQPVAVKVPHRAQRQQYQSLLVELQQEEIDRHRRLDGAGIPRFVDAGFTEEQAPVLVMEWIEGRSLGDVMASQSFTPVGAANLIAVLAETVDSLHCQGFTHRDLAPHNILITAEGRLVLIDLGVALHEETQPDQDRQKMGTLYYQPPECWHDRHPVVDQRYDIWSLGAILYELLAGRLFKKGRVFQDVLLGLFASSPWTLRFPEGVSEKLRAICCKCLQWERDDRFQAAGELASALRRILEERPDDSSWDAWPLLAWRIGMRFGAAVERLELHKLHFTATSEEEANQARRRLGGYLQAWEFHKEAEYLWTMAKESGSTAEPESFSADLLELARQLGGIPLFEHHKSVETSVLAIDQCVERTFGAVAHFLRDRSPQSVALWNLAVQPRRTRLTGDSLETLVKCAEEIPVPKGVFDRYLEALRRNARADEVRKELVRMNQRMEMFLIFGAIETGQE